MDRDLCSKLFGESFWTYNRPSLKGFKRQECLVPRYQKVSRAVPEHGKEKVVLRVGSLRERRRYLNKGAKGNYSLKK